MISNTRRGFLFFRGGVKRERPFRRAIVSSNRNNVKLQTVTFSRVVKFLSISAIAREYNQVIDNNRTTRATSSRSLPKEVRLIRPSHG